MMELRKANERGHANHGWLDSYHSFSFADYYDPRHMGYSSLRVINEDMVQPGQGFGTHGHRDMEIITYILDGALEHKDSIGNGSIIRPGDVQRMSAGTGVRHSEFNPSPDAPVHLLQIWIEPVVSGIAPGYEERHFDVASRRGRLCLIAANGGRDGAVNIHQDAAVYAALIDRDERVQHSLAAGRRAYVHVARGNVTVNGQRLAAGDALKISGEPAIVMESGEDAEVLLFDLT
jgi:redox-sensitive bicupin YhaK (pirin superfamily)